MRASGMQLLVAFGVTAGATAPGQEPDLPVAIRKQAEFQVGGGVVHAIDVHPGRGLIVTGGELGGLVLRSHPGGKVHWRRRASDHWFRAVRFSPVGDRIAASARTVTVWDLSGAKLREWPSPGVVGVAWSPDGALLAMGQERGVTVVDTKTWQVKRGFQKVGQCAPCLAFRPDSDELLAAAGSELWSMRVSDGSVRRLSGGGVDGVKDVRALEILGKDLFLAYKDGSGRCGEARVQHGENLYTAAARGGRLVIGGAKRVQAWDRGGRRVAQLEVGGLSAACFEPSGTVLLGTYDGRLCRWDFDSVKDLANPHPSAARSLTFSQDSSCLVAEGRVIVRCEVRTGVTKETRDALGVLGTGPAGREILTWHRPQKTGPARYEVRDAWTFQVLRTIPELPFSFGSAPVTLAPDRRTVFRGDRFFDIVEGKGIEVDLAGNPYEVAWSPKGHVAICYGIGIDGGCGFRVFGPDRKGLLKRDFVSLMGGPTDHIASPRFSPSGRFLTYVEIRGAENLLRRVDMETMEEVDSVPTAAKWWQYLDKRLALAWSPQGLQLWDAEKLTKVGDLKQDLGAARSLVLSPDRQWLAVSTPFLVGLYHVHRRR